MTGIYIAVLCYIGVFLSLPFVIAILSYLSSKHQAEQEAIVKCDYSTLTSNMIELYSKVDNNIDDVTNTQKDMTKILIDIRDTETQLADRVSQLTDEISKLSFRLELLENATQEYDEDYDDYYYDSLQPDPENEFEHDMGYYMYDYGDDEPLHVLNDEDGK